MANINRESNGTFKQDQTNASSPDIHGVFTLVGVNIFLSVTASLGNALILIALRKVDSIHPPTKLLFLCLSVSDLCVGLISQPLGVVATMALTKKMNSDILYYIIRLNENSSLILCGVSILLSTAISVDRLLALFLGLRYRHVVTLRCVRAVLMCFLLVVVSIGLVYVFWSIRISLIIASGFVILAIVISIVSYTKIFLRLRHQQQQVQLQSHVQQQMNGGGIPLQNLARYKTTVTTIAWLQLTLVACYVPFGISVILLRINGWTGINADMLWFSACTLVYLNSSLNPILYYWKLRAVRQAVKDTARQFC